MPIKQISTYLHCQLVYQYVNAPYVKSTQIKLFSN